MESHMDYMNFILDIHVPFKRVNKYKLRFPIKPWVTLLFLYLVKTLFLIINCKDSQTKEHLHTRYKW